MTNKEMYQMIVSTKNGDSESMARIIKHFEGYINSCSMRAFVLEDGTYIMRIDEDIKNRIISKLIYQIVMRYDVPMPPQEDKTNCTAEIAQLNMKSDKS